MKNPKEILIIVFDTKENFADESTQLFYGNAGNGEYFYFDVIQFDDVNNFDKIIENLDLNREFVICCHVNFADLNKGYLTFKTLPIFSKYNLPLNNIIFLSSQQSNIVSDSVGKKNLPSIKSYLYNEFHDQLKLGNIRVFKKNDIAEVKNVSLKNDADLSSSRKINCEIIVICAIQVEFNAVLNVFDVDTNPENQISFHNTILYIQKIKVANDKVKTIGFIRQSKMGMVDSAILTTQILHDIEPKIILMAGVCAANPNWYGINFGDIIIPNQTFAFQFGKISDDPDNSDDFVFEPELHDSKVIGELIPKFVDNLNILLSDVISSIPKNLGLMKDIKHFNTLIDKDVESTLTKIDISKLQIHHEKDMACSISVIDKTGYFKENVEKTSRNAIGLEMEGYGIARACELSSLKTKSLIVKSVMDKSQSKDDTYKQYASYTSAYFIKHLLNSGAI